MRAPLEMEVLQRTSKFGIHKALSLPIKAPSF